MSTASIRNGISAACPLAPITALVLAVICSAIGALADSVTPLFPELVAIFDTITDILAAIFASLPRLGI